MEQDSQGSHPLMVFTGNWKIEGSNSSVAPSSANTKIIGIQTVQLMEGGQFIEAQWQYTFGDEQKHSGISIIGTPQEQSIMECHNFDNLGFHRTYDSNIETNTWKLDGEFERATIEFDHSGKSYNEFWEIKKDGKWQPLCKRTGTKTN